MLPPAPPEFSTMTVWPRFWPMRCAMIRAMASVDPPGGNGLTSVTVREGNGCGCAVQTRERAETNRARTSLVICVNPGDRGETTMPYRTVEDLPKAQTDQYNPHQKEAFLKAFNNAYKELAFFVGWCYFLSTNGKHDDIAEADRRAEGKG